MAAKNRDASASISSGVTGCAVCRTAAGGAPCEDGAVPLAPVVHAEVAQAVTAGRAVVALESTIFSNLGLPDPANREALERCVQAVRDGGAVPALTAVL